MKQLSTRTISIISLIAIAILALGIFAMQRVYNTPLPVVEDEVEQKENLKTNDDNNSKKEQQNIDENIMAMVETFDVSDWQLYSNNELGFSVKLPPTFDLNDPRIYEDEKFFVKSVCFPDNQDMQLYANEGAESRGPRLLCFKKGALGNVDDLMTKFKDSSNQFVKYNILISHDISAKLYFGFGSGIIFESNKYRLTIEDSYTFKSATIFNNVSNLYYLGMIKTFVLFDEKK
ncbi:MAG: hypothetical protein IPN70_04825 [Candidatus Moraniibacteriota bacterium]|nr:MAG: hypothetical protein IPN70_04825 [Candidatus Moranbacteria bacterium]